MSLHSQQHAPDASSRTHALSKYSEQDEAMHTDPQSSLWHDAPAIVLTCDNYRNPVPGHRTEVRSRWTEANLYFLFLCPYEELHLKPTPETGEKTDGLWNWDVAETFIGSVHEPLHRYKEFEISPQGEWLDLDIDLTMPNKVARASWSSGWKVTARIDREKSIWYGAMQIPYGAIEEGKTACAGDTLRINFFRSQGPKPVELAWQAPLQESFHAPERFGTLRLV